MSYATISNEGRHAGRGGLGAVMGSKLLKAIAVSGDRITEYAQPDELIRYSKELSKKSFGDATAKYRELVGLSLVAAVGSVHLGPCQRRIEHRDEEQVLPGINL